VHRHAQNGSDGTRRGHFLQGTENGSGAVSGFSKADYAAWSQGYSARVRRTSVSDTGWKLVLRGVTRRSGSTRFKPSVGNVNRLIRRANTIVTDSRCKTSFLLNVPCPVILRRIFEPAGVGLGSLICNRTFATVRRLRVSCRDGLKDRALTFLGTKRGPSNRRVAGVQPITPSVHYTLLRTNGVNSIASGALGRFKRVDTTATACTFVSLAIGMTLSVFKGY